MEAAGSVDESRSSENSQLVRWIFVPREWDRSTGNQLNSQGKGGKCIEETEKTGVGGNISENAEGCTSSLNSEQIGTLPTDQEKLQAEGKVEKYQDSKVYPWEQLDSENEKVEQSEIEEKDGNCLAEALPDVCISSVEEGARGKTREAPHSPDCGQHTLGASGCFGGERVGTDPPVNGAEARTIGANRESEKQSEEELNSVIVQQEKGEKQVEGQSGEQPINPDEGKGSTGLVISEQMENQEIECSRAKIFGENKAAEIEKDVGFPEQASIEVQVVRQGEEKNCEVQLDMQDRGEENAGVVMAGQTESEGNGTEEGSEFHRCGIGEPSLTEQAGKNSLYDNIVKRGDSRGLVENAEVRGEYREIAGKGRSQLTRRETLTSPMDRDILDMGTGEKIVGEIQECGKRERGQFSKFEIYLGQARAAMICFLILFDTFVCGVFPKQEFWLLLFGLCLNVFVRMLKPQRDRVRLRGKFESPVSENRTVISRNRLKGGVDLVVPGVSSDNMGQFMFEFGRRGTYTDGRIKFASKLAYLLRSWKTRRKKKECWVEFLM